MHYSIYHQRRFVRLLLAGAVFLLLAACSSAPAPQVSAPGEIAYVGTVQIAPDITQAEVEAMYGGQAVVFRPEAGFAMVGFSADQANMSTLNLEPNSSLSSPEASAQGLNAWAGGLNAWAGGWNAWAGGWNAWAGGSGSPTTFGENLPLWSQVGLAGAQQKASNLGANIIVAVIDTGIDLSHPAVSGKLSAANTWKDYVGNDSNPSEVSGGLAYGHGTAVAGVILQVAPNAKILPIRVLGPDGSGTVANVAAAVDWAVQKGAKVINLSLGSDSPVAALQTVLEYAANQGVYIVASSGNTGDQNVTYPASAFNDNSTLGKQAVGVGSVSSLDLKSSFSTYGNTLEMVAPGESIHTLYPGGMRAVATGTSFAAPMASGSLALALGQSSLISRFTPTSELASTSDNINSLNSFILGKGRLNVAAFVNRLVK